MGDDKLPSRQRIGLVVVLLLLLLIPNIIGSTFFYEAKPKQESSFDKTYNIDHLITKYALMYMVDEKLARKIICCESNFNQDAINKKAVIGEDVGLFQLNSHYWQEHMASRGWDIYNTEDNIQAGMWLLSTEGSKPWTWSAGCWN